MKQKRLISVVIVLTLILLISGFVYATWFDDVFSRITGHVVIGSTVSPHTIYSLLDEVKSGHSGCKIVLPNYASNNLISSTAQFASYFGISSSIFEREVTGSESCLVYIKYSPYVAINEIELKVLESTNKVTLYINFNSDYAIPSALAALRNYASFSSQLTASKAKISGETILPYEFGCGEELDTSMTYTLNQDYSQGEEYAGRSCFYITADNVVLDGNGYSLLGNEYDSTAIVITGNNVTVKNLTISGFAGGISSSGLDNEISDINYNYPGKIGITASNRLIIKNYNDLTGFSFSNALLSFENRYGKLEFKKSIKATDANIRLLDAVKISPFLDMEVNTSLVPNFNKPAMLSFYNSNISAPIITMFNNGIAFPADYWNVLSVDSNLDGIYDQPFMVNVVGFSDFCVKDSDCGKCKCIDNLCLQCYVVTAHGGAPADVSGIYLENTTYDGAYKKMYLQNGTAYLGSPYWLWGSYFIGQCLGLCTPATNTWKSNGNITDTYSPWGCDRWWCGSRGTVTVVNGR